MKTDRRTDTCLNCHEELSQDYKYCPNCGQKNSDNYVSVGTLLADVFSNYFSLDSKFAKSFVTFFFRPGILTKLFIEGKRASFVQPVRLYVLTSLMFFFIMTTVLTSGNLDLSDVFNGDESITENGDEKLAANQQILDSLTVKIDSLTQIQTDSAVGLTKTSESEFYSLMHDSSISDKAVLDSLGVGNAGEWSKRTVTQVRKIFTKDVNVFISFVLGNIPIMMVFVVPILALILKLLYIRRNTLYITHLVHAIHLHAFAYFVYSSVLTMIYFSTRISDAWEPFISIAIGVVGVYGLVSFFTVYKQTIFKTFTKFIVVGFVYVFLIALFLSAELFLSTLYF